MRYLLLLLVSLPLCAADEAAEKIDLLAEIIAINKIEEPELDEAELRKAFTALVDGIRPQLAELKTPRAKIAVLNQAILTDREVSYLSNKSWRDATLAGALLRKKGNCTATSILYVLVARELGLPIRMVHSPRHSFVRWDDGGTRINIETTAGGIERTDEHYLRREHRADPADIEALGWFDSLDDRALLAEQRYYVGWHLVRAGRHDEGRQHIDEAIELRPNRADWKLARIQLTADRTGDRATAAEQVLALLDLQGTPPGVIVDGLCWLADEAAARKNHQVQRRILLEAYAQAPKTSQVRVLNELASCHRSLKDWRGAVRYMELAVASTQANSPDMAAWLYNLAIYQKNDGDLPGALRSIDRALLINEESWNLQVLKAGYLVLSGEAEEGKRLFATVEAPRADEIFWLIMNSWFHAVCGDREKFYPAFEKALVTARGPRILIWLQHDVDLDPYREEERFKELVAEHRARIMGGQQEPVLVP